MTKGKGLFYNVVLFYKEDIHDSDKDFIVELILKKFNDENRVKYVGNETFVCAFYNDIFDILNKLYIEFAHIKTMVEDICIYHCVDSEHIILNQFFNPSKLN